jgi:hypothetical protein
MTRGRPFSSWVPFPFWVTVLTVALLGLLGPIAHICPADPRWLASSTEDPDLDDQLLLAADGVLVSAKVIPPAPRGTPHLVSELGAGCTSADPGSASCTRAPPVLLARSV